MMKERGGGVINVHVNWGLGASDVMKRDGAAAGTTESGQNVHAADLEEGSREKPLKHGVALLPVHARHDLADAHGILFLKKNARRAT